MKKLGEIENWKLGDHELSCICYMHVNLGGKTYVIETWRK